MKPIGVFRAGAQYPYEARRQADENSPGLIQLEPGFEQALEDLEGFERIWIIYQFHHNSDWKPKVMPPRGPRQKRGVFATRAPYRPNPIGLSCVRLVQVEGLKVFVEGHDLLDGTPVFDIKPYLPYADAFPDSKVGWLEDIESERRQVEFTKEAEEQLRWLEQNGIGQLRGFIVAQLEFDPLDHKRKRVVETSAGHQLAYRTWRVEFVDEDAIRVLVIRSGYTEDELADGQDRYGDKETHRRFALKHPIHPGRPG